MFDIGFWELSLIGVVALLVIGPERLPGVARTAGMWIGRVRGFVGSVQADINQELGKADQLKALLEEQAKIKSAHEIIEETASDIRESLTVPAAKPDYAVKAQATEDAASDPEPASMPAPAPPMSRSVAASSSAPVASVPAAALAAKVPVEASEPSPPSAKADDVKA